MKLFVFALFVAAAVAAPIEDDVVGLIVNGVPEGEAVELGHILGIKVQEHVDGEVIAATDLLHPLTAVGIAEAAAAVQSPEVVPVPVSLPAPAEPEVIPAPVSLPAPTETEVFPAPVSLPAPAQPEFIPAPVSLPAPAEPEVVPAPVALPAPAQPEVIPAPVALPAPVKPEVSIIPEAVVLPAPANPEVNPESLDIVSDQIQEIPSPSAQTGEVYNDGTVQVTVNAPESGIMSTIQGWFSMVMNYISDGDIKTQQIV